MNPGEFLRRWFFEARWINRQTVFVAFCVLTAFWAFTMATIIKGNLAVSRSITVPFGWDFTSYWLAGQLARAGDAVTVFRLEDFAEYQRHLRLVSGFAGFFYPPIWLLFVLPLAFMPFTAALLVFSLAGFLSGYLVIRHQLKDGLTFVGYAVSAPVFFNLVYGQNGTFSLAFLGGGLALLSAGRPVAGGILIGAMTFKPHLGLFVPFALVAGSHWRTFSSASITTIVLVALSAAIFGPDVWSAFIEQIPSAGAALRNEGVDYVHFASIFASLRLHGVAEIYAWSAQIGVSAFLLIITLNIWRQSRDVELQSAFLICAGLLATPFSLSYDLVLLAWPFCVLVRRGIHQGFFASEKTLLALAFVIPFASRFLSFSHGLQINFLSTAILCILLYRRYAHTKSGDEQKPMTILPG